MALVSSAAIIALGSALTLVIPAEADDTSAPASSSSSTTTTPDTTTTPTDTSSPAPTTDPTAPAAPAPVVTPTPTPTDSSTPTPTPTDSATPVPTPTGTATPTPTPTPSSTATPSVTVDATAAPAVTPAVTLPKTVVTFTFDDGNADTVTAAPILNSNGFYGTYYTNSGTIGQPGYQTRTDLSNLYAAGNEIGGHTVNHPDLPTLPTAEAEREICLDRDNLLSWGFPVTDFAYPFADTNATIDGFADTCGYNSARNLGDIQSRFGCAGCEYAESIPPANAYELAALDEADDTWTLADLESTVTNAQTHGGGWVILTFHHICDNTCDPLAVTPELFTQFVDWLKTQTDTPADNTTVETVAKVIGGAVKPAVVLPPAASSNNVTNPSLETLDPTTNLPTCWAEAGFGTNTAAYTIVTPGHSGTEAAQLTVSAYTDGDAKVMPTLDLGTCTPAATPGQSYQLSTWYKSTAQTQYDVYYRTTEGAWVYWTSSPFFGAESTWTQSTWVTPPVPAGAAGIDFGLTLESVGTLTTDDYNIAPAASPLATTATVTPINPNGANGWYNTQPTVSLSVDNSGVASTTEYSFNGGNTWTPYTGTVTIPTGRSTFSYRSVTATQTEGTQSLSFAVDTDLPTVIAAFSPTSRTFSAFGSDATSGPNQIRYSYDGGATWTNYTAPVTVDNAAYSVEVEAIDVAGNASLPVTITEPPITTATVSPAAPNGLAGWYTTPPTVTLAAGAIPPAGQVTYYSYDGVTFTPYTAPLVVPDGTATLSYNTSGAGLIEPTHTLSLKVDSTPPVVVPAFDPTTRTYSVTVSDAASQVASIEENVNNAGWVTYPGPTVTSASSLSVLFRATDIAGNVSAAVPLSIGGVSATTLAAVSPAAPNGSAGWYTVAPQVLLSASGTVSGQVIQYAIDNGTWTTYAGALTIGSGVSTLEYRTIGTGFTEATHTLSFSVDLDAPVVVPAFNSATRTWSATATDGTSGLAGIQVRAAGSSTWSTYTAPVTIGNASLSLEFEATDVAGHTSTVVPLTAGAITTASVSPATPNGSAGWYRTDPTVTLSTGAASLGSPSTGQVTQYSYNGTTWVTYTTPVTIPDGTSTFSYRSIGAGITESAHSLMIKADSTAPVVTPSLDSSTGTFSATATDSGSGVALVQYSSNGTTWNTYTAPIVAGTGATSFEFRATDVAGNTSPVVTLASGGIVTASISPAAPNGANGWYVTEPSVTLASGTLLPGQVIQYSLNGTTWNTYTVPIPLPTGQYTLHYRTSGSAQSGSLTAKVDLANPVAAATVNTSTRIVTASATDTGSGVASLAWRTAGGTWAPYTAPIHLGAAATTLQFQATDVAGRVSAIDSLGVGASAARTASKVSLTLSSTSVVYGASRSATVAVSSAGIPATGAIIVTVDGRSVGTAQLLDGSVTVALSKTLAIGTHSVSASYAGSAASLPATSSTVKLRVTKAKTTIALVKAATTARSTTGAKTTSRAFSVTVHVLGSHSTAKGRIAITVNGKTVKTVSLRKADAGSLLVRLPHFTAKGKFTVRAHFLGSKTLKAAKSKKLTVKVG